MKKKIAILGSTGSIGKTLIKILSEDKKNFQIVFLSAKKNYKLLFKHENDDGIRVYDDNYYFKVVKS